MSEVWTCWRCTHPLCIRLAQAWEVDHARLLLRNQRRGDNPETEARLYERLEFAAMELTSREEDPPKCIGTRMPKDGYYSHAAAPMELVEVGVVEEIIEDAREKV